MAITRVTGAQPVQNFGAGITQNGDWEGYALQRLDNGRVVAIWKTLDGSTEALRLATLDASGANPQALQLIDSGPTSSRLQLPGIASTTAGGFFSVWEQDTTAPTALAGNTYGQAFDAAGIAASAKAHLSNSTSGGEYTPSVTRLGDGNFLVTWADTLSNPAFPPASEIMARKYSPAGVPIGNEFQLNTTTSGVQLGTDVTSLGDGRAIAVWGNATVSGASLVATELRGRFIAADGTGAGADFQIDAIAPGSTYQDESLEILALGNGGFVVVWEEETNASVEEIHFQRFSSAGAKLGGEIVVESTGGSFDITQMLTTELANGGFAVAWRVFDDASGSVTSHVRAFDMNGTEIGTETSLNAIANPGLALIADLELMRDGHVLGLGVTATGVATQVFDFGDERLLGTAASETLYGKHGVDDQMFGFAGNDTLDGGSGIDTMTGGLDNDTYYVDNFYDVIVETANQGYDVVYASSSFTLQGQAVEELRASSQASTLPINLSGNGYSQILSGNNGNNTLNGNGGADTMYGRGGNDIFIVDNIGDLTYESTGQGTDSVFAKASYTLTAGQSIETLATTAQSGTTAINLTGNSIAQTINGNNGNNVINGLGGSDTLFGRQGSDTFVFSTALGTGNGDTIGDYNVAFDTINLSQAIFTAIGATLDAGEFVIGSAAADADDRIIYNSTTGALIYDSNGSAAGGAEQFATLSTGLSLIASEFLLIA